MTKRTYLITGASKGIGLATALRLGEAGHAVIGLARTEPAVAFPGPFHTVDLADRQATGRVLESIVGETGIDGILNNVGLVHPAPLEDITLEQLDAVLDLNQHRPRAGVTPDWLFEPVHPKKMEVEWNRR